MTPKPPPSSDGSSLPPRSRPNLGDFVKDSNELDLWAFDDLEAGEKPSGKPPSRSTSSDLPVPRETRKKKEPAPDSALPVKSSEAKNSVRVNVSKERPRSQTGAPAGPAKSIKDFDELDDWDEVESVAPDSEIKSRPVATPAPPTAPEAPVIEEVVAETTPPAAPAVDDFDEFSRWFLKMRPPFPWCRIWGCPRSSASACGPC